MKKYTLGDIIKDAKNSCDVLNELAKMVKEQHEVKISDPIHKLVLRKMEQILPEMNLKYENGILMNSGEKWILEDELLVNMTK